MDPSETTEYSFARLLRMEWAEFRRVRGRVIGMVIAALVTVLPGLLIATGSSCRGPQGDACPPVPLGPGGEAVRDRFFFVHQPLTGDGSITARVTSLTGLITYPPPNHDQIVPGVVPWAKAGVIIKESTTPGSAYAAMMITGGHGVRMQYDFTGDTAGHPGGVSPRSPRWLRLTRSGNTLIGYESTDGAQWSRIGTAQLTGLPATVEAGLFVTSPCNLTASEGACRHTSATASFDHVGLEGNPPHAGWSSDEPGAEPGLPHYLYGGVKASGDTFTVTGSGDIAPLAADDAWTIQRALIGTSAGMIAVIVVAGLFGATRLAGPRPGPVLTAKAVVVGIVTGVTGMAAAIIAVPLAMRVLLSHGIRLLPVAPLTGLRVMFGTAALFAVAAIFALALGALLRHGVAAVIASLAVVVLPHLLAVANVLPVGASQWLVRFTPAAGFAIQQSVKEHPQVIGLYTPLAGYYPLAPWTGFAVLCGYAALAFGLAIVMLHRRSALVGSDASG
jgi:hypothetical protein